MTKIETKTLEVIAATGFTFKGDSHFRTYRQATITLNRLARLGLIVSQETEPGMTQWVANA